MLILKSFYTTLLWCVGTYYLIKDVMSLEEISKRPIHKFLTIVKLKDMKFTMKLYDNHFIKVRDNMDNITLRVQKIHLNYLSTIINEINKVFMT